MQYHRISSVTLSEVFVHSVCLLEYRWNIVPSDLVLLITHSALEEAWGCSSFPLRLPLSAPRSICCSQYYTYTVTVLDYNKLTIDPKFLGNTLNRR